MASEDLKQSHTESLLGNVKGVVVSKDGLIKDQLTSEEIFGKEFTFLGVKPFIGGILMSLVLMASVAVVHYLLKDGPAKNCLFLQLALLFFWNIILLISRGLIGSRKNRLQDEIMDKYPERVDDIGKKRYYSRKGIKTPVSQSPVKSVNDDEEQQQ
eukprot:NODE_5451_length_576_cov_47.698292_g4732_i0.p1 GENE.NODE_5451_length_576_cov_47.698292_g4732_i0~~NODE_5451_length_576_cov_47.698292_g4732_i0.p1  ORF type:complete len:156 (-),score=23.42 NODE_5451_length_576_cov_47.698292_g4732_i0:69-536(-)